MKIGDKLKKDPWVRRVHPDMARPRFVGGYKPAAFVPGSYNFVTLTQQDFLNELAPAAHPVNSTIMSKRPIYGPSGKTKDGKEEWVIVGYDDVEVVPLGWQEFICNNKVAHLATNGFDLANETDKEDAFNKMMSWFDYIGLKDAYKEAVYYCERSGDSGIYIRQTGEDRIEWDVYAVEKGYTIYPQLDENGDKEYYIAYKINGRNAVDIISKRGTETWIQHDENAKDEDAGLWGWVAKMINQADGRVRSDDGYVRIKSVENQLGGDVQFVYFRVPDVSWGPAQLTIESLENACSYVAEEVKNSAFPILFLKSEKIQNLPPSKINGKTIGVKGATDSIAHSDAKFLTPPDASNVATIHLKELRDNVIHTTMTAVIEPEILKQGADSSTSIKILFRPEIEWANIRWIYYVKPVRQLVDIAKNLVRKVEGAAGDEYKGLRMSVWFEPWIPQNEAERIKTELDQYYAGVKSAKAVMIDIGNTHLGDWEQILKEEEERKKMDAKYKSTSSDDDNPNNPSEPGITNEALNKPKNK
jgi:hypothetical protein